MTIAYSGPLRDERLAIELHNTVYAAGGAGVDALDDPAQTGAWLAAIAAREELAELPDGPEPSVGELRGLRTAVRSLVASVADGAAIDAEAAAVVNATCAAAPGVLRLELGPDRRPVRGTAFGGATRSDVLLAAIAADAVDLLTGPLRDEVRVCGAPGCVLAFVKTHPRRSWCSNGCGNRARQARHYHRVRGEQET
ncbi:CGNR zinc finger domain-containing protein [Patulibacter minatonensis]|uniref:CGNR zinc finger domain-containing protein n=1 Tax=Patulibacter minatonensis TaxID=298163 RepID=UPI000686510E|nr:ABATE domain-containing protein [Patulibacter minatonensis]